MIRRIPYILLVMALISMPAWSDDLTTLTGKSISGTLEKIGQNDITLKSATGSVTTPLPQALLLSLRAARTGPTEPKYIEVQLLDDSLLRCTKIVFGAKESQLTLTSGPVLKVPNSAFVAILRDAQKETLKKQFDKLIKDKSRRDRIFTLRDEDLNPIPGVLGDIDEAKQTISFTREGAKEAALDLERLQAIQFIRTDLPTEAVMGKIIDIDSNHLVASKLSYSGGNLDIGTPYGAKVSIDLKVVAKIDFNFGKLTYLSDLESKVSEIGFLGGFNPVRKDANLDGNPIMLADKKYEKGLSVYAGAELEYNLAGKYKEFKAILGADSRIAEEGQGKVTVAIYCNRQMVLTKEVSTKEAVPIAVNVKDVDTLRIVVSGSNITNYAGHATLANAQVTQ